MTLNTIKSGDTFTTNQGCQLVVVSCESSINVVVEFLDKNKYKFTTRSSSLRHGRVKNPFYPSMQGVGYLGVGNYRACIEGKHTPSYRAWTSMMGRCYNEKFLVRCPIYTGCSVHPDWHNFQAFSDWYKVEPNSDTLGFELDKDLRQAGNKIYGPYTCSFVPQQINVLLGYCGPDRGLLPQGVKKNGKKFEAQININGHIKYLGNYDTPEIAFNAYKNCKESHVKLKAKEWRKEIHFEVYDYLMNWTL